MESRQGITAPLGITVYGSAISKEVPDTAVIRCAVSITEQAAQDAFLNARNAAKLAQKFLQTIDVKDYGASRATLLQQNRFINGEQKFIGYQAKVSMRIELKDLDGIDEIVTGLVEAGVNEIQSITFETTRLEAIQSEARAMAIADAKEKATEYCKSAGVALGPLLHIEDANPQLLGPEFIHRGGGVAAGAGGGAGALDPSKINVSERVLVAFEIRPIAPAASH
jgi:uncharacterized protein YggE